MRNLNVTYAKAIGIILMVLLHSEIGNDYIGSFITMFHMPLFFFFSGYCLKTAYFSQPHTFAWKRLKGIYWPYVKWSIVFLLLHNAFFALHFYDGDYGFEGPGPQPYTQADIGTHVTNIICRMSSHEMILGGYWFMRALFVGSLMAFAALWVLQVINKKTKLRYTHNTVIAGVGILALCCLLNYQQRTLTVLYFCPQDVLAAVFFIIGHYFRQIKARQFYLWEGIAAMCLVLAGSFCWKMSTAGFFYENWRMLPYIVTAVLGTWVVYSLPYQRLQGSAATFIQFIGNNTLTILTWHFVAFKLVSLLIIYIYGLPIARLAEFPTITDYAEQGWWVAYFIVGMAVSCAIAYSNRWIRSTWLKL